VVRIIPLTVLAAGLFAAAAALAADPAPPAPDAAPKAIQRACVGCHDIATAAGKGRTPQEWSDVIDRMTDRGVDASDAELAAMKAYLAKTLPPGAEGVPKDLQPAP
jgi:cytochrome c2